MGAERGLRRERQERRQDKGDGERRSERRRGRKEEAKAPATPEELTEALDAAIASGDKGEALKLAAGGLSQGLGAASVMALLEGAGLRDGFVALIREGRPHSPIDRARMNLLYHGGLTYEDKVTLFEARYNVTITGDSSWTFLGTDPDFLDESAELLDEGPAFTDEGPAYMDAEDVDWDDIGLSPEQVGLLNEGGDLLLEGDELLLEGGELGLIEEGSGPTQWVETFLPFTEPELDAMYDEANRLPAGHVEDSPTFRRLHRLVDNAFAEGTHGGDRISMSKMHTYARYTEVFRHEVGHAVDAALGAKSEDLRLNQAGWRTVGDASALVSEVGWGKIPEAQQAAVLQAIQTYMAAGGPWDSPGSFDTFLEAEIADEEAREKVTALYGANTLLDTMRGSEGRFYATSAVANWPEHAGKAYFVNFYYKRVFSLKAETRSDLVTRGNDSANFSDKEWFAEMYQEWYAGVKPGSGSYPGFVKDFFKKEVEPFVASQGPDGGGGGNPRVPR